jgi:hypothetical protein
MYQVKTLRLAGFVAALVLTGCGVEAAPPLERAATGSDGNPGVAPLASRPLGQSYADWAVAWWKWIDSIPYAVNPLQDHTGQDCAEDQSGQVWFLAGVSGGAGGTANLSCTLPAGKHIFFPIVNFINDYPCPEPPPFEPAPGQSLADFLLNGTNGIPGAKQVMDTASNLSVTVDGVALKNVSDYRTPSGLFCFTANLAGNPNLMTAFDSCLTNNAPASSINPCTAPSQPGLEDGYYIMLEPLSRGTHTIHLVGQVNFFSPPFVEDVTYHLTVGGN